MALANDYLNLFLSMRGMVNGGDEFYSDGLARITSSHANTWRANLLAYPNTPILCSSVPSPCDAQILASCLAMRTMSSGGNRRHANDVGSAFHQMIMAGFSTTVFSGSLGPLQEGLYDAFANGRGDEDICERMAKAVTSYLSNGGAS